MMWFIIAFGGGVIIGTLAALAQALCGGLRHWNRSSADEPEDQEVDCNFIDEDGQCHYPYCPICGSCGDTMCHPYPEVCAYVDAHQGHYDELAKDAKAGQDLPYRLIDTESRIVAGFATRILADEYREGRPYLLLVKE